jgi:hypothetical protein
MPLCDRAEFAEVHPYPSCGMYCDRAVLGAVYPDPAHMVYIVTGRCLVKCTLTLLIWYVL